MNKHIPGPWRWGKDGYLYGAKGLLLGIFTEGPGMGHAAEPNLRLIATAPELLDALSDLVATIDANSYTDRPRGPISGLAYAREVIAKARGDR